MLPLILGLAAAGSGKYVKVLDPSNFDSTVESKEFDVVIVEFYAPWCGHCKHLEPEWAKAAEELHSLGKRIALANVDATAHESLGQRFEVRGYPTLKIFRGDPAKPEEYDGPRDAPGIVKYALDLLAPAVDVVDSEDALQKVIAENTAQGRRTLVAYANEGSVEASAHETAAKANRKYFRFARAPASAKPANTGDFGIVGSGDEATWQTGGSVADLVADNKFALVAEISQNNYADYVNRGLPIVWAFVNQGDASKLAAEIAELDKVAKPHKGKVSVVYLDGGKYGGMAARMGLTGTTTPSVAVENAEKAHWSYDESAKWDGEKIAEWLGRVLSGDIKPTVKSEPKPADPVDEAGVTTLVGDTFAEIVGDAAKDVLVEFYAPWCGHCKHLAPIYAELGTLVKNTCGSSSEVVIAKMDATANDVPLPGFQVSGYPTIYFAPAAAGATPITFEGERTVDGFASFLAKKGKTACAAKLAKASDEL